MEAAIEIIKYEGNERYFIALFKKDNELYAIYAKPKSINLNLEAQSMDEFSFPLLMKKNCKLEIPFELKNNTLFSVIKITDTSQYDLIKNVLESFA